MPRRRRPSVLTPTPSPASGGPPRASDDIRPPNLRLAALAWHPHRLAEAATCRSHQPLRALHRRTTGQLTAAGDSRPPIRRPTRYHRASAGQPLSDRSGLAVACSHPHTKRRHPGVCSCARIEWRHINFAFPRARLGWKPGDIIPSGLYRPHLRTKHPGSRAPQPDAADWSRAASRRCTPPPSPSIMSLSTSPDFVLTP